MICDISYLIIRAFLPLCSSILFKMRESYIAGERDREKIVENDVIFLGHNILSFLTKLIYKILVLFCYFKPKTNI